MSARQKNIVVGLALLAISAVAAVAVLASGSRRHHATQRPSTTVKVDPTRLGITVPKSFLGVSLEVSEVPAVTGLPATGLNRPFVALFNELRRAAGSPPSLRVGGGSADATWWNPDAKPRPRGIYYDLNADWMSGVAAAQRATRAPLTLTLNLAQADPAIAAQEAQAALDRLPHGSVSAFEMGNEPDFFTQRPFAPGPSGHPTPTRDAGYDFRAYVKDFVAHVRRLPPGAPVVGPGFASALGPWTPRFGDFLKIAHGDVSVATMHGYALTACPAERQSPRFATIPALLSDSASRGYAQQFAPLAATAKRFGKPFRVTEGNSAACAGQAGVSDSFASALWATDTLFELAEAGVRGINFHSGGQSSHYTPFVFGYDGAGHLGVDARPLYYGMMLFARAAPSGSRIVAVRGIPAGPVKVWATLDHRGVVRVVVINKGSRAPAGIAMQMPRRYGTGALERMTGSSLNAKRGVSIDGQTVPFGSLTGRLTGPLRTERIRVVGGTYRLNVPAASAALLTIQRKRRHR